MRSVPLLPRPHRDDQEIMRAFISITLLSCLISLAYAQSMPAGHPFENTFPHHAGQGSFTKPLSGAEGQEYCYYFGFTVLYGDEFEAVICDVPSYRYYNHPNGTMSTTISCSGGTPLNIAASFENIDSPDWSATVIVDSVGSIDLSQIPNYQYQQLANSNMYFAGYAYVYPEGTCATLWPSE